MVQANSKTGKRLAREAAELAAKRKEIPMKEVRYGRDNPKMHVKGVSVRLHPLRDGVIATERNVTSTWKKAKFSGRTGGPGVSANVTKEIRRGWVHKPADGYFRDRITGEVIRTESMGDLPIPGLPRIPFEEETTVKPKREPRKPRDPRGGKVSRASSAKVSVKDAPGGTGKNGGITNADCDSLIAALYKRRGGAPGSEPKITAAMRKEARGMLVKMRKRAAKKLAAAQK